MRQPNDSSQFAPHSLDSALTRALETPPQPAVPADFTLRVLSHLPSDALPVRPTLVWPKSIPEPSVGRRTAFTAAALMLFACISLPVLSTHTAASHQFAWMAVWALFVAEFIVLTVWISLRPDTLR